MSFITGILGDFLPIILIVIGGIGTFFGYGVVKKRQGKKEERRQAKEDDNANAKDIRNRVRDNLADKLRDFDGDGFRD